MMESKQTTLMKTLYWNGKEMDQKDLVRESGMTKAEVRMAVYGLKSMGYVKVRFIKLHYENGVMINNQSFVRLTDIHLAEKTLKKRGTI